MALAEEAGISRKQLAAILGRQAKPQSPTIRALLKAVNVLEMKQRERTIYEVGQIERLRVEVKRHGAAEIAHKLDYDLSNFLKLISGKRLPGADFLRRIAERLSF